MAQGTVMPNPKFTGFDNSGDIVPLGLLYTYAAGTTTALATYSDVDLLTANANPVVLDSAGRATVFLAASSYKFVLKSAASATLWTQDNIAAGASYSVNLTIPVTAGEAIASGEGCYLSDGSGSKTAGKWYRWDADFTYASTLPQIAVASADIAANAVGAVIRAPGRATVAGPLTPGTTYYISNTAGALSATAGTNSRTVGVADTTTTIVLSTSVPLDFTDVENILANQVFS